MPGMKAIARAEEINLGFQIAPMIDVVFVIMLFFMVMAGALKVEREFRTSLPRPCPQDICGPDALCIKIYEDGSIELNDEEIASAKETNLNKLTGLLTRIQNDASARKARALVTIEAEEDARYQRIMDVFNSLSKANISDVTFTVGSDD